MSKVLTRPITVVVPDEEGSWLLEDSDQVGEDLD